MIFVVVGRIAPEPASASGETDPPVDGPAAEVPVVAGPARVPDAEEDCGAVAGCGAVAEPVPVPVDDVLTEVEPVAVGAVVLLVSWVTTADPAGLAGTVVVVGAALLAACRFDSDGVELPLPLTGTVVVGAGEAVVAGAAVVGVVVATVVGELPAAVPWVPVVPAGALAGAVSAEAGPELSTRKSPVRSAKAAAHLRGLTASILALVLMGWNGTA